MTSFPSDPVLEAIRIRDYEDGDAAPTLAVFLDAITHTASADYTPQQVEAWARRDHRDLTVWNTSMQNRVSFVATMGEDVVGFSDVSPRGYIDMMFVAPQLVGRGVAWRLLAQAEQRARATGTRELSADVSITARPFFERQGFVVTATQHPIRAGVTLTNYAMRRVLD
ncbi:GNAT family N-acetyltransferase [Agreia sp. COWG]|uniref:GNAT family N-acetyltransferase n=1 Tax=Agreia sp. COWG TaxID=2773266 RepID=UPI001925D34C|nr:GNAT family N-acetyltransferase [Agreia sp. COWG]CAD5989435.1 Acetyltransferase [Agreia sp. COWG]